MTRPARAGGGGLHPRRAAAVRGAEPRARAGRGGAGAGAERGRQILACCGLPAGLLRPAGGQGRALPKPRSPTSSLRSTNGKGSATPSPSGSADGGRRASRRWGWRRCAEVPVRMLSTGQRKRAALARVVASEAPLVAARRARQRPRRRRPRAARSGDGGAPRGRRRDPRRQPPAARARGRADRGARMIGALILRELRLAATGGAALLPLVFFLLVATLFPFAVGPDGPLLARTGGGALVDGGPARGLAPGRPADRAGPRERRARPALPQGRQRGEHRLRQAGRPLAELRAASDARRPSRRRLDEAAAATCWPGSSSACSIGTPGLAALTLGVGALTAGLRRGGALAGLLLLPLAVPLLIFGAGLCRARQ